MYTANFEKRRKLKRSLLPNANNTLRNGDLSAITLRLPQKTHANGYECLIKPISSRTQIANLSDFQAEFYCNKNMRKTSWVMAYFMFLESKSPLICLRK